jgi:choline monooxygenase
VSTWLPREIEAKRGELQNVLRPIAEAGGLPNETYTSERFAAVERDEVLARTWACIGVGAWVPKPGDLKPVQLQGLPLVLVRGRDGELRVFHNVCSHRGLALVTQHGLKPVRSALWADAVFVDLSGEAPAFADFIAPLATRWADFDMTRLRHGGADSSFAIEVGCNWKLAVENYCEAYHLPWIHPALNKYSRLEDHYNIAVDDCMAGQGSTAYRPSLSGDGRQFPAHPGLSARWDGAAEYLALFPNVLFGVHSDHFYTVVLEPLGPARTREHFEIYYFDDAVLGDGFADMRATNARQWQTVFEEDRGVVEGMQAGRASPAFTGGVFSPAMDGPTHCFHQWMARALLG